MGADIVDGMMGTLMIKDGHEPVAHRKSRPLPLWNASDFGNCHKLRHQSSSPYGVKKSSVPGRDDFASSTLESIPELAWRHPATREISATKQHGDVQ